MDQVSCCGVGLEQGHLTAKYPHFSNPEIFVYICYCNFHNQQTGCVNNGPLREPAAGNRRFSLPHRSSWTLELPQLHSLTAACCADRGTAFALDPRRNVLQEPRLGQLDRF